MTVHARSGEFDAITNLNAWCAAHDEQNQQFAKLNASNAGGEQAFSGNVWAMASGDHFPADDLAAAFPNFGWRFPYDAILIVSDEQSAGSRVYRALD